MIKRIFFIISLLLTIPLVSHNVIFDFNGVLMGTNTRQALKAMGFKNIVRCMLHLKMGPTAINMYMKAKFFEILNNAAEVQSLDQSASQTAYDEMGQELPYLMRAWLDGTMTCSHIKKHVFFAIKEHPEWFCHAAEKQVLCNLINMIFTPDHFVKTRIIYQSCITFIKACKKQGHNVFGLSNWDKESFALLQKQYPDIFGLFDGIIISGEVNTLKPSSAIYTLLLTRYNLDPQTCWFIDDQQENITAASALGIHGVICHPTKSKRPNFRLVARTIKQLVNLERLEHANGETAAEASLI